MVLYDATIGNALHVINSSAFAYYFVWIAVTPFIDATHSTQAYFPPREYGLVLPAALVVLFVVTTSTVASLLIIASPPVDQGAPSPTASPARPSALKPRGHVRSISGQSAKSGASGASIDTLDSVRRKRPTIIG